MEYNYIEKRYNVMGLSSIGAFAGIKGGMNGNCKDVYFLRVVGVSNTLIKEIENMDEVLTGRMRLGQSIYSRTSSFPKSIGPEEVRVYADCYDKWVNNGRKILFTKRLNDKSGIGEILSTSCQTVLKLYKSSNPHLSESIEKNFVVKILFWLDELIYDYLQNWNPKQSMKFAAQGVTKEQEYLFCYLLTLMGIDVLLIQNAADIDGKLEGWKLSDKIVLGEKRDIVLEAYDKKKYEQENRQPNSNPGSNSNFGNSGSYGSIGQGVQDTGASSRPRVIIPDRRGKNSGQTNGGNTGQNAVQANSGQNAGYGRGSAHGNPGQAGRGQSSGQAGRTTTGQSAGWDRAPGAANAHNHNRELEFEELALRASSVVMIGIHNHQGEIVGSGSGIMVGPAGYILTNNHVARGGAYYSVRIENDDAVYKTDEIIKYNSLLDLAIIRIQRKLQPLPVYRGRKPLVRGQKVVAIGSPLGLFNSVSNGIISGFRTINDVDMIQFTAPISHGSSGGAVLNMYGEVIGVSTAGIDDGQNINLAVGYEFINTFIQGFQ